MPFAVVQDQTTLSAEFGNDYILEQVISTFANAAARDAAIIAPNKGQHAYLESTDQTLRWSGSEWIELLPAKVGGLVQKPVRVCTSTTRPNHSAGQQIYETDTNRTYCSDGTSWTYLGGGTAPRVGVTFWGGWQNYGVEFETIGLTKVGGMVFMSGLLQNVPALNATAYTWMPAGGIPVGYRPSKQVLALADQGNGQGARIDILPDGSGSIVPSTSVQGMWYFGINISYPAA